VHFASEHNDWQIPFPKRKTYIKLENANDEKRNIIILHS